MMGTSSFSHLTLNLVVGLCKGSSILKPHSESFRRKLGYEVFAVEPSFQASSGKVNPDAVICSKKVKATLIVEWTECSTVGGDKEAQLHKYLNVTKRDIVNVLGVPRNSAESHDTCLIVAENGLTAFVDWADDAKLNIPILGLIQNENAFSLLRGTGTFKNPQTDAFFSASLEFERIPNRYVPFALDDISPLTLTRLIVQSMLSLLLKGNRTFDLEMLCENTIPVWRLVGPNKRKEIMRVSRKILTNLSRSKFGSTLIKRTNNSPPEWRFEISSEDAKKRSSYLRSNLMNFISKEEGKPWIEGLFDDVD